MATNGALKALVGVRYEVLAGELKRFVNEMKACLQSSQSANAQFENYYNEFIIVDGQINHLMAMMQQGLSRRKKLSDTEYAAAKSAMNNMETLKVRWTQLKVSVARHSQERLDWQSKAAGKEGEINTKNVLFEKCRVEYEQCKASLVIKKSQRASLEQELVRLQSSICKIYFQPRTCGEEVTLKAIDLVRRISLEANIADISLFLVRIARVESRMGQDSRTYRSGYFGGIWQVDDIGFDESKNVLSHPSLGRILDVVDRELSRERGKAVTWRSCSWECCMMPAYSCIAARLLIATIVSPVPSDLKGQAVYWKDYYNRKGAGTVKRFIEEVE